MLQDTVAEYRQAIHDGLKQLTNTELESLIIMHFPEIHYGSTAWDSCKNILEAPCSLRKIWIEVDKFLATFPSLKRLVGEAPPADLHNRSSGRLVIPEEIGSRSGRQAIPEVIADRSGRMPTETASGSVVISTRPEPESSRSYNEITVEQVIPINISAATPTTGDSRQISLYVPRSQPEVAPSQTSKHILIGFLTVWFSVLGVGLSALHFCAPLKNRFRRSLVEAVEHQSPQLALSTRKSEAPPTAPTPQPETVRFTIPVPPAESALLPALPSKPVHHDKNHRGSRHELAADEPSKYTSLCDIRVKSWEFGKAVEKPLSLTIHVPRKLDPGSKKATEWRIKECKRINSEMNRHPERLEQLSKT